MILLVYGLGVVVIVIVVVVVAAVDERRAVLVVESVVVGELVVDPKVVLVDVSELGEDKPPMVVVADCLVVVDVGKVVWIGVNEVEGVSEE